MIRRAFPFTLVVSLVLAAYAPIRSQASEVDSILIRSVGGAAAYDSLAAMRTLYSRGSVDMNGQEGEFTEVIEVPDRIYLQLDFGHYKITQGYDGRTAWQRDLNGRVAELTGFEKDDLLRTLYHESFSFLFSNRLPGRVAYVGDTSFAGTQYQVVAFYPFGTDTALGYFDTATGLRRLLVTHLDNLTGRSVFGDYRWAGGVLLPFYSRAAVDGTTIAMQFQLDSVALNVPVDTTVFSRPATRESGFRFPPNFRQLQVPMTYARGHLYVPITINGCKRVRMILDSGASATILDDKVAEELRLASVGNMPARGIAGFGEVRLVKVDSVAVGDLVLSSQICGTTDLSDLAALTGGDSLPFGGVLGYDFLSRFPVLIDYSRGLLTIFNPTTFTEVAGIEAIPFTLTMQVPTVEMEIAGARGKCIVDLGNAFGLILHDEFVKRNGLAGKLRILRNPEAMAGIGGGIKGRAAIAPEVKLGGQTLDSLPVVLSESSGGLTGSSEIAGNIGNEVLQRYRVLIDYPRRRLYLLKSDPDGR